jgi:ParB family chromosome partitioning protein
MDKSVIEKKHSICLIPVSKISLDKNLPRSFFSEKSLEELSSSIKEKGILQSLVVRRIAESKEEKYQVIIGKRRFRAALLADIKQVPCILDDVDDKEALELALTENIQREDLMPLEESLGILRLIKDHKCSVQEVCRKLGKSNDFVANRLKLLQLPEKVQKYVAENKLGIEQAVSLTKIESQEKQEGLAEEIIKSHLSRNQSKELILKELERKRFYSRQVKGKRGLNVALSPKRIVVQAGILTRLLEKYDELNIEKLAFGEREEIIGSLARAERSIRSVIQKIKQID